MAEFDLSPTSPNPLPNVDLRIGGGGTLNGSLDPAIGRSMSNPLAMVGQYADIQNAINQNRLFQQTFAARQLSGQILASAPDTETAIKQLMSNPTTAPFAPETIASLRQGELALTQIGGEVQTQAKGVMDGFYKMMPAVIADPTQFDNLAMQNLQLASPSSRPYVFAAMSSLRHSLFDGLPMDQQGNVTPEGMKLLNRRLVGYSYGAGVPPSTLEGLFGTPTTRDVGSQIASGVQLPAWEGGGFEGANAIAKGIPPTPLTEPLGPGGTQTTGILGGEPGRATFTTATMGNALAPGQSQPTTNLIGGPGLMTGPSQAQAEANTQAGKSVGDINAEMQQRSKELPTDIKRLDMMVGALDQFQSGGGSNIRQQSGKLLQALANMGFPIPQETLDNVANGSLPASQIFDAEVRPLVISELKQAAQGTGRVMRSEVDAFLNMMDKTGDPRALIPLLNQARYQIQVGYDQATRWPEFKKLIASGNPPPNVSDYGDFFSWYNQQHFKLPTQTGAGLSLGPTPLSAAKGTAPVKISHRYDPKLGRIVPVGGP